MKNVIPRIMTMSAYGLNKFRNMLQRPNMCDIHCSDFAELTDIVSEILFEYDCDNCAIFMHSLDDKMYVAFKEWDEVAEEYSSTIMVGERIADYDFFSSFDAEFKLCCYGLLVEINNNEWRIIDG